MSAFVTAVTDLFDIERTVGTPLGYPLSYVELVGTLAGLASVWLATRANVWTWPTGVVNVVCLFALFYQVQLYADMSLQVFFLAVTAYGWWSWGRGASVGETGEGRVSAKLRIAYLTAGQRRLTALAVALGTLAFGGLFAHVHEWLPAYFSAAADYPYVDSFVLAASVAATYLLAEKRVETWWLWLAVDVVCVGLFFRKGIYFLGLEYAVFLVLAGLGWRRWWRSVGGSIVSA